MSQKDRKVGGTFWVLMVVGVGLMAGCSSKPVEEVGREAAPLERPTPVALATPDPTVVDAEDAVLETDLGVIRIRFFPDVAPQHVAHFKQLVKEKFYDGLGFHRAIPGNLIQGGDPQTRSGDPSLWGMGMPGQPTVPAEFNTRPFVRGAVGAARKGGDVDSATSQFFISLMPHPEWDGKYTVFGEVIEGIETAEKISQAPSNPMTQKVEQKVAIRRVRLEPAKR
jgi:cyclophilin family peptidyl-prolyl cis-trans isomerase